LIPSIAKNDFLLPNVEDCSEEQADALSDPQDLAMFDFVNSPALQREQLFIPTPVEYDPGEQLEHLVDPCADEKRPSEHEIHASAFCAPSFG
jgi:hypothetical protein